MKNLYILLCLSLCSCIEITPVEDMIIIEGSENIIINNGTINNNSSNSDKKEEEKPSNKPNQGEISFDIPDVNQG